MRNLKSMTLEMSLKPLKCTDDAFMEAVFSDVFAQWRGLLNHADSVSVMLWASDGSEILEYRGALDEPFEWAKYIGGANPRDTWSRASDPDGVGLHTRSYLYTEEPPTFTYRALARVVAAAKAVGARVTGLPVRVGATFDPGPEFAKSDFKYSRHPEILLGDTMGHRSFVCCYQTLKADAQAYAGYPSGVPDNTPFGEFLGRQCQRFLTDLGFDYVWLSNGFGFGSETWGTTGAIFDGQSFAPEKVGPTQARILQFWQAFRRGCPTIPVETRGTNLTAGIDLATDAVNLKGIYGGGFDVLPPPNSPWAALNGDFGLELAGYMSRIAELPPKKDFLFRFYVHDPWWMNSPWIDRYEGQPHDIYLPLAIGRIDAAGQVQTPSRLNLLSIDTSLGDLPEQAALEVTPHLLRAYEHAPDAPSPCVWVYPFGEYHEGALSQVSQVSQGGQGRPSCGHQGDQGGVGKPFFEDWFIRGAINHGLPLSTVVSTDNYATSIQTQPALYDGSVIVTPVPPAQGQMERALMDSVRTGGSAVVYGSLRGASQEFLEFLGLGRSGYPPAQGGGSEGVFPLYLEFQPDTFRSGAYGQTILHSALLSDGGLEELRAVPALGTKTLAEVDGSHGRSAIATSRTDPSWCGGTVVWLRGTSSNTYRKGEQLLTPHDPSVHFPAEALMRLSLREFGISIAFDREAPATKCPVTMIHRHDNAFYFSGYVPDTTAVQHLHFPLGAPLLVGTEARVSGGYATYVMPRAWHAECRVFVEQGEGTVGVVSCRECPPVSYQMRRRLQVTGLANAVVRVLPPLGQEGSTELLLNSPYPHLRGEALEITHVRTAWGPAIEAKGVTGTLLVSSPRSGLEPRQS